MDGDSKFPNQAQLLCRVLGPTKNYGNKMVQWCLKENGKIVPRRYVVTLTTSQMNNNEEILKQNVFTNCIRKRYGDTINLPPFPINMEDLDFPPYEPVKDRLMNNQVYIPQGESMQVNKVSQRILDEDGKLVGTYYDNPMLNTLMYDVNFPDGATKPYAANMIADNIHNSVDLDGHRSIPFGEIPNYCKTANTVAISDAKAVVRNGKRYQRKTTAG